MICFQNKKSFSKEVFGKEAQEVPVLEEYKGWVPWWYAVWMCRVATKLRGEGPCRWATEVEVVTVSLGDRSGK